MEDFFYETDNYRFRLEKGIFFVTYKTGPITLEIAKEIVGKRCELMKGQDVWALIDDANLRSIDRDARDYLSSDEGIHGVKAGALLVSAPFAKHLANFFLKITVNKPKIPTKVFSKRDEALNWLNELKKS